MRCKPYRLTILYVLWILFATSIGVSAAPLPDTPEASLKANEPVSPEVKYEALAAESSSEDDLGTKLPLWSIIPFIGILLSIAVCPLIIPHIWHHHFGKISAFWSLTLIIPFLYVYGAGAIGKVVHAILHTYILEYIPFIILLWSLYTVSGGIFIKGAPVGIPRNNLVLLIIGTVLASWIGTTGAAMVLIRPYIKMNRFRKSKVHLIVFFIFLVANVGGSLTPLGDPPLFMGFLNGVKFFWTFNIFTEMLLVVVLLLLIFFAWDSYMFRKEGWREKLHEIDTEVDMPDTIADKLVVEEKVEIEDPRTHAIATRTYRMEVKGLFNLLFLLGIVGGVLFSGYVHLQEISVLGIHVGLQSIIRDVVLVIMGLLSLKFTPREYRKGNDFNWFPIQEVAILFAGIFITMIPALAILRAGEHGQLAFIIRVMEEPWHYFWITGTLSSFLDNAPTYLVFFNTALGKFSHEFAANQGVLWLMNEGSIYLKAISTGAVFFGANTYIGNAPNFMVKSIAEQADIKMPSFFGYMIYSVLILGTIFVAVTLVFF
jgi:Na+/H+ antiporter NhaD/arsenite permease-like protein